MDRQRGSSLIEAVFTLAVMGILLLYALPNQMARLHRVAMKSAAGDIEHLLMLTQIDAQTLDTTRAVKFYQAGGDWYYAVYEDGNGNGVLNSEILSGVDRRVAAPVALFPRKGLATIGFPRAGVPDPDSTRTLTPDDMPVNFNGSTLCSFSPNGKSTPGTIFITDGDGAAMVRASGASGRVRIVYFDGNKWDL